jgi:hypothetical protein
MSSFRDKSNPLLVDRKIGSLLGKRLKRLGWAGRAIQREPTETWTFADGGNSSGIERQPPNDQPIQVRKVAKWFKVAGHLRAR